NSGFLLTVRSPGRKPRSVWFNRQLGGASMCSTSWSTASAPWLESQFLHLPGPSGCQSWHDPIRTNHRAAVLLIGGSNESVPTLAARALAAHGYPSLAVAYYGGPDLPSSFKRIELGYFVQALDWLRREVKTTRVFVYGFSRGSEAALLLAVN